MNGIPINIIRIIPTKYCGCIRQASSKAWRNLALTTKQLGDVRTRRSSTPRREGVDDLLLLGDRIPLKGGIDHEVHRHASQHVLGADQRVSSVLLVIDAGLTALALPVGRRQTHLDGTVVGRKGPRIDTATGSRKRNGNRIDSDGLRIGKSHGTTPRGDLR